MRTALIMIAYIYYTSVSYRYGLPQIEGFVAFLSGFPIGIFLMLDILNGLRGKI